MLRILLALILPVILMGCSIGHDTPIQPKPPVQNEDFSKLGDDQLCEISFIRIDPRIDKEINKRNLYCDAADLSCRKQGFHETSLAMIDCVYKEKLKNQSPNMKSCSDSGVDPGDVDDMTACLIEKEKLQKSQQSDNF
jgi:hypothetical protein